MTRAAYLRPSSARLRASSLGRADATGSTYAWPALATLPPFTAPDAALAAP
jgi:hypothetical protein